MEATAKAKPGNKDECRFGRSVSHATSSSAVHGGTWRVCVFAAPLTRRVALSAQCNRDDCWYFHPFGKDPTLWGSKGRCYFCGGPHMKMNCPHKVGRPAEWFIPPGTATHRGPMAAAAAPQVIYDCLETLSLLSGRSSCHCVSSWCVRDQILIPRCFVCCRLRCRLRMSSLRWRTRGDATYAAKCTPPSPPRSACCWALTKRWRRVRSGHLSRDCPTLGGESKPATSTALATNVSTPANRLRLLLCVAGKRALRQSSVVLIDQLSKEDFDKKFAEEMRQMEAQTGSVQRSNRPSY